MNCSTYTHLYLHLVSIMLVTTNVISTQFFALCLRQAKLKTEPELLEQLKRAGADASMVAAARVEARESFRSPAVKAKAASERAFKKRRINAESTKEETKEDVDSVVQTEEPSLTNENGTESKPWSKNDPTSNADEVWQKITNSKSVSGITALLATHQHTGALLAHAVHTIAKKKLITPATIEKKNVAEGIATVLRHCATKAVGRNFCVYP